jgi:hypothetical protein
MLGERSRGVNNTRSANRAPPGHVPYRDASLTMLLRDSFGGGSCTSVVINVAGETTHVDETACSLRFGERMSVVRNEPTRVLGDANARSSRVGSPGGTKVGTLGVADLKRRLAVANGELNALELRSDGGGFVKGGPVTEIESLRRGMEKLAVMDAASAKLRVGLAEARGDQGGGFAVGGGAPEDHQGHLGRAHGVVRQESRRGEADTKRAGDGGVVRLLARRLELYLRR